MYDTLGRIMKKTIVRIGAFVYIIGMVMVAFSLIGPPRTITEQYQVQNSSEEMNESVTVSPGIFIRMLNLTEGHSVHIQVEVTAGGDKDIDFYVTDGTKIHIVDIRVTTVNRSDWTVPHNGTYQFVYDNNFSLDSKNVTSIVTKYWIETEYREVTRYLPLIPHEFSYVGLILSSVGIGVFIYGLIEEETPAENNRGSSNKEGLSSV